MAALLHVERLSISYQIAGQWIRAVHDFRIDIQPGQIDGLVGESGSGKTTAAGGILHYLPANGRIEPGSAVELQGDNLSAKSPSEMRSVWGRRIGLVPQNPAESLNPSMRIGEQIAEVLRRHMGLNRREARQRTIEMFRRVHLPDEEQIGKRYPHQLSGGMQQRVMIAMALCTSPQMLILDEPTTNLDVTTEAIILDLVRDLIRAEGAGALYVTHNLGVVSKLCDRVTVMYAGEIMEDGPTAGLFARPLHPYTIGLLNSVPILGQTKERETLHAIEGHPPALTELPQACVYVPRCPFAIDICRQSKPPLEPSEAGRSVRCHRWQEIAQGELHLENRVPIIPSVRAAEQQTDLLSVEQITKYFAVPRSTIDILRGVPPAPVRAVDGVSFRIPQGQTVGLVGESGSGKTTLARIIIGLEDRSSGSMDLLGADIRGNVQERSKAILAQMQMVFQNPQNSLNPYMTVGQAIRRPLIKLAGMSREAADREVVRLLEGVNLRADYAQRYPSELSGGEKQRVAIARAFASDPALLLCDEPVSSLDVSVQAAVLNLLARLQAERGTAYLFISHDLAVVGYLADIILVMYLGQVYEVGRNLFKPPLHPYTEALVSAIPSIHISEGPVRLSGEIPNPRYMPSGCRFHTRCPHKLGDICEQEEPPWQAAGEGHLIRCHRTPEDLAARQSWLVERAEMDEETK